MFLLEKMDAHSAALSNILKLKLVQSKAPSKTPTKRSPLEIVGNEVYQVIEAMMLQSLLNKTDLF